MISCILAVVCGVFVLLADQLTKYYIISNFSLGESTGFIKGLLEIVYIHNTGGAWGMLSGKTWFLLLLTAIIMVFCVFIITKYWGKASLLVWALCLVVSGGIGNLLDRAFRDGNVIDFLQFAFWRDFPVFNVADCAIVIGAGLLILYYTLDTVKEIKSKKEATALQQEDGEN